MKYANRMNPEQVADLNTYLETAKRGDMVIYVTRDCYDDIKEVYEVEFVGLTKCRVKIAMNGKIISVAPHNLRLPH